MTIKVVFMKIQAVLEETTLVFYTDHAGERRDPHPGASHNDGLCELRVQ